jgi:hypothetical protein
MHRCSYAAFRALLPPRQPANNRLRDGRPHQALVPGLYATLPRGYIVLQFRPGMGKKRKLCPSLDTG